MPYFERSPSLVDAFREQHYRMTALERVTQEAAAQSYAFAPNVYPDWVEQSYISGARVEYLGTSYKSTSATASTDVPGTSAKWTSISGASLDDTRSRSDSGVLLNNISAMTSKTATLLDTVVTTGTGGVIETYVRMTADASGSGNSMVLRISIDGVSQGSYLSWSNQSLTEKKTIQGSTVGTSATPSGGFIVIDDAAPNKGWDDTTSTEINTIFSGLVLDEGPHTITYDLVCTGTGSFGSVYSAAVAIRTT